MGDGPETRQVDQRYVYRPTGVATAGELAYRIADVLTRARDERSRDVLVDIRAVRRFESPGPAFRRWAVGLWAGKSAGAVRVAMAVPRRGSRPPQRRPRGTTTPPPERRRSRATRPWSASRGHRRRTRLGATVGRRHWTDPA